MRIRLYGKLMAENQPNWNHLGKVEHKLIVICQESMAMKGVIPLKDYTD